MDLSLLYFLFPRLSESRVTLKKSFILERGVLQIKKLKPLPMRRENQLLRLICLDDETWLAFCRNYKKINVTGITRTGGRFEFTWVRAGGGSIDYKCPKGISVVSIEVHNNAEHDGFLKLQWICQDHTN